MYFFNLRGAIKDLKAGPLPPDEVYKYLAGFAVSNFARVYIELAMPYVLGRSAQEAISSNNLNWLAIIIPLPILAVFLAVALWILRSFFWSNGGHDGRDLLTRLLAVTWVLGMRAAVAAIPLYLGCLAIMKIFPKTPIIIGSLVVMFATVAGLLIYIVQGCNASLREISKPQPT